MTYLIAAALWVLILPPVVWHDGEPKIPENADITRWGTIELYESGVVCPPDSPRA